jgi:hypothetical protein
VPVEFSEVDLADPIVVHLARSRDEESSFGARMNYYLLLMPRRRFVVFCRKGIASGPYHASRRYLRP